VKSDGGARKEGGQKSLLRRPMIWGARAKGGEDGKECGVP
jgi:hypothetical protein